MRWNDRAGEVRQFGRFLFELLDVVLAEMAESGVVGLADDRSRELLGDGDECDVFAGRPARSAAARIRRSTSSSRW